MIFFSIFESQILGFSDFQNETFPNLKKVKISNLFRNWQFFISKMKIIIRKSLLLCSLPLKNIIIGFNIRSCGSWLNFLIEWYKSSNQMEIMRQISTFSWTAISALFNQLPPTLNKLCTQNYFYNFPCS